MRHTPDLPVDPLGGLGAPVRDPAPAPAAPAPAKGFELGNWAATLPEGLAEKPAGNPDDCAPAALIVNTLSPEELQGLRDAEAAIAGWLGY